MPLDAHFEFDLLGDVFDVVEESLFADFSFVGPAPDCACVDSCEVCDGFDVCPAVGLVSDGCDEPAEGPVAAAVVAVDWVAFCGDADGCCTNGVVDDSWAVDACTYLGCFGVPAAQCVDCPA